jgi:glucose/arabinose dehydrogenase
MQCQANLAPGPHQNVGQIVRIDMETKQIETVAYGVRNSVGFDFDPVDHKLWWTDNGRDDWDPGHDDRPPDELNRVDEIGKHYGFPFCYGPGLVDYEFNAAGSCANYVNVTQPLQPHAAALGMRFARSSVFPAVYQRGVFVAEHGSWDRDVPVGYRVTFVSLDAAGNPLSYEPFLQGLMSWNGTMKSVMGRPVDVEFLQDGSMLMTDDSKGRVYRIWYDGQSSGDSSGDSDDTVFPEWSKWLIISVTGATVLVVGTCMVCRARRKNKGYRSV